MRAETEQEIAELVVEAVEDVLGYDITEIHLYDGESELLVPAAATDRTRGLMPEPLTYPIGEGLPGEVFEQGDERWYDDITTVHDYDYGEIRSAIVLPLGEHGTLSIGETTVGAFDESDSAVANILTTNAETAFDRATRQQTLVHYETILENVEDMIYVIDEEGRFTFVTQPLAERLGYDRAQLVGEHVSLVLEDGSVGEGQAIIEDLHTTASGASQPFEADGITADGERFPVESELSLLPSEEAYAGSLGVVRDISELAETRSQLADERNRFTYLFENLPDPVVEVEFVDEEPRVRSVNPEFTDVFGYDTEEACGESLTALLGPSRLGAETETFEHQRSRGKTSHTEVRRGTATGLRYFLFRGVPYLRGKNIDDRYGFGIYTDITEQKERERYLQVVNRILRHNLRNDLTAVGGYAGLLIEELDDPELVEYAALIQEISDELSEMSETAREIERIVGRRGTTELDAVEITSRITDLVEEYRSAHPDVEITTELPDCARVVADQRLDDVLDQLLGNAIEHNDQDVSQVEIRVDTGDLDAGAENEVSVTVLDNGPGIPEREREVVQGEREITQLDHATGIGLWLVKWVLDSYGGDLSFAESDSGGTAVTLRFNRADAPDEF